MKQKTLKKQISCECKYEFDSNKCSSTQIWNDNNVNMSAKIQEKMCAKMVMFVILLHVVVKMVDMQKVILSDEIIETTKAVPAKSIPKTFNEK